MWPASKPTPEPVTAHSHTSSFRPHKQPVSSMEALNFKHSATRPVRLWECGPPPPASSRPLPVKGRRVRAPSGPPFRPFGPVERFPNFRAHWNCRAERDTGHGLAEGPRAAHSRGPAGLGPHAPSRRPLRHGASEGARDAADSTEGPDAGEEAGRKRRAPRRRPRAPGSPAGTRLEARPPAPARRPFLLGPHSLSSIFLPVRRTPCLPPPRSGPNPPLTRVRRAPAPASRTPPGTRDT